jgi:hypothetical protein
MRARFIEKINTEIKVYDAETTIKELFVEGFINFILRY